MEIVLLVSEYLFKDFCIMVPISTKRCAQVLDRIFSTFMQ
jgi:hypothetical protein